MKVTCDQARGSARSHGTRAVNVRRTYSRRCSRRTGTRPRPCVWVSTKPVE